jgi:hypothetical protein
MLLYVVVCILFFTPTFQPILSLSLHEHPLFTHTPNNNNIISQPGVITYDNWVPSPMELTVLHNASSWHALFLFGGYAKQEAYRDRCFNDDDGSDDALDDDDVSYVVRNHPLPLTTKEALEIRFILSIFSSLFVLIALCYAPASFVSFVVKERACKSKHLQIVSGNYGSSSAIFYMYIHSYILF